jgi:uncharacterized protein (DUF362 family)
MNRRHFFRAAATASAAALAGGGTVPALGQDDERSRVVIARNLAMAQVTDEAAFSQMLIEMVHESVRALVGGDVTREAAWRTFLKPQDVVGVKLNCIAPPMVPHPAMVEAVAQGAEMCGIPRNKVIAFDKEDRDLEASGYTLNFGGREVQVYGTVGQSGGNPGYEERQTFRRDTAYKLSRIVSRQITAIVNVPVIKDHCWAGITCALKNHFGCIDNPNAFHKLNACCPAVIDVGHDQNIKGKQRLVICDARAIQYEGGPSFKAEYLQPYYAVLAATDPVALDATAIELINMCRAANGLEDLNSRERKPVHVAEGARQKLGTNDASLIDYVVRDLGPAEAEAAPK